jgi:hypothetical protein
MNPCNPLASSYRRKPVSRGLIAMRSGVFTLLDSGLRRNDGFIELMDNPA